MSNRMCNVTHLQWYEIHRKIEYKSELPWVITVTNYCFTFIPALIGKPMIFKCPINCTIMMQRYDKGPIFLFEDTAKAYNTDKF